MNFQNVSAQTTTLGPQAPVMPKEPSLRERLNETLNYLSELMEMQHQQRQALVGPEPKGQGDNSKMAEPPSVEWLAARCCEMAAMAVSEARSILNRL